MARDLVPNSYSSVSKNYAAVYNLVFTYLLMKCDEKKYSELGGISTPGINLLLL
jgi:hypothetical protein